MFLVVAIVHVSLAVDVVVVDETASVVVVVVVVLVGSGPFLKQFPFFSSARKKTSLHKFYFFFSATKCTRWIT